jgi:hypothetical protein
MKSVIFVAVLALLFASSGRAYAWDGPGMWYQSATGGPGGAPGPGAGGIMGTGGQGDHDITCAHCHVKGADGYGTIDLDVDFNPPVGASYKLGQAYQVTFTMRNEHLGKGCSGDGMKNANQIAAAFEDDAGKPVGALRADYGSSASCPASAPAGDVSPGTYVYSDCRTVFGRGADGATSWTFTWTAPAQSTPVTLYYGGVDGDCMMDSLGDDAKVGTRKLGGGVAMREVPSSNRVFACIGLLPALGMLAAARKRARSG